MQVERIAELILEAARGNRTLNGGVYRDEPIIRTGKQAFGSIGSPASPTRKPDPDASFVHGVFPPRLTIEMPERIKQMHAIARESHQWVTSYTNPTLFYEQARFMVDYEDDLPYDGVFSSYYPTYEDMTLAQLRGYFTWRTRYRAGKTPKTSLSFLFVHAYELLCGIGVSGPEEGIAELKRLRDSYGDAPGNSSLTSYLDAWIGDYAVYHGLDSSYPDGSRLEQAVSIIDRAEAALLASPTPDIWNDSLPGIPGKVELVNALAAASTYRIERSKVFTGHMEELSDCCASLFAKMVDHCRRRRKKGFSDGLFGQAEAVPYTMFRSAVFHDPEPQQDRVVRLGNGVVYSCRFNHWTKSRPHGRARANGELGDLLHEIDRAMRPFIEGVPELKPRDIPRFMQTLVDSEVKGYFERKAAEEAARVRIDRSALGGIRAAAIRTRESLLLDEEREESPVSSSVKPVFTSPASNMHADIPAASTIPGLEDADMRFLLSLLSGADGKAIEDDPSTGFMVSLAVDRINEAFFDIVGDAVIDYDGDAPHLVEDYLEDVREAVQ